VYKPGQAQGRGGLSTEATERLRARRDGAPTSSKNGAARRSATTVVRCCRCTRPLDKKAIEAMLSVCSRCTDPPQSSSTEGGVSSSIADKATSAPINDSAVQGRRWPRVHVATGTYTAAPSEDVATETRVQVTPGHNAASRFNCEVAVDVATIEATPERWRTKLCPAVGEASDANRNEEFGLSAEPVAGVPCQPQLSPALDVPVGNSNSSSHNNNSSSSNRNNESKLDAEPVADAPYRSGMGRGRGGLDVESTDRLRARREAEASAEALGLPEADNSVQTDFLLGNGAIKVARCGKCTRPLDEDAKNAKEFLCYRCNGRTTGCQAGRPRSAQGVNAYQVNWNSQDWSAGAWSWNDASWGVHGWKT